MDSGSPSNSAVEVNLSSRPPGCYFEDVNRASTWFWNSDANGVCNSCDRRSVCRSCKCNSNVGYQNLKKLYNS